MYIDAQGLFSNGQDISAPAVSENIVDTKVDGNLGVGEPMAVVVVLPQGSDDTDGDEVYGATLQTSSDDAFTSPVDLSSIAIPRGADAGSKFVLPVPADGRGDRFFRVSYAASGTTPVMNGVKAFLIPQSMIQNDYIYADAITIS